MIDSKPADWWDTLTDGERVGLGFVKVDRKGSTEDWDQLSEEIVLRRRASFAKAVEDAARQWRAAEPLHWQGDGVMLFFRDDEETMAPVVAYRAARAIWERVRIDLNMSCRIAVHGARVPWFADTGQLAHPAIDRCGHLEHVTPANGVAVTDDVYWLLPDEERASMAPLGVTRRDGTAAYLFPGKSVSKRDPEAYRADGDLELWDALRRYTLTAPEVRRLRYVGFRLQRREPSSLDLLDVFTPLNVETDSPDSSAMMASLSAESFAKVAGEASPKPFFRERLSVRRPFTEVVTGGHLVVLGDPGSGKTTLLRWLAIQAARGSYVTAATFGVERRWLPLIVSIGRLAEWRKDNSSASLADAVATYVAERAQLSYDSLRVFIEKRLEARECLLLFDGLDETERNVRHEMTEWLEGLAVRYPGNTIVVTSRRVGYAPIELPQARTVGLGALDDDGITSYLRAFHRAYLSWESRGEGDHDADADEQSKRLEERLRSNPRLKALAANPFLLSAIALIHRSEGSLPQHRVLLYEVFARALCEAWSAARRLVGRGGESSAIPYETEAIPILGRLALAMHEQHPSGVAPTEFVVATLASALQERSGQSAGEARAAAECFLERAGEDIQILYERGPGMWSFLHLTFQEFFVAAGLHAQERFEETARAKLFDPRWDEVIRLGVGYMALVQKRPEKTRQFIEMVRGAVDERRPWVTKIVKLQVPKAAVLAAEAGDALPTTLKENIADDFIEWAGNDHARVRPLLSEMANSEFAECLAGRWHATGERWIVAQAAVALRARGAEEWLERYCEAHVHPPLARFPSIQRRLRNRVLEAVDPQVRMGSLYGLDYDDDENIDLVHNVAVSDRHPRVREAAVGVFGWAGTGFTDRRASETLQRIVETEEDEDVRGLAALTLARRAGLSHLESLAAAVNSDLCIFAWEYLAELSSQGHRDDVRGAVEPHARLSARLEGNDLLRLPALGFLATEPDTELAGLSIGRTVLSVAWCYAVLVAGTRELWVAPLVSLLAADEFGAGEALVHLDANATRPALLPVIEGSDRVARRNAAIVAAELGIDSSAALLEALDRGCDEHQTKRIHAALYRIATSFA